MNLGSLKEANSAKSVMPDEAEVSKLSKEQALAKIHSMPRHIMERVFKLDGSKAQKSKFSRKENIQMNKEDEDLLFSSEDEESVSSHESVCTKGVEKSKTF